MIPAALLCVILSACADQQPTGPEFRRIARDQSVPFNSFFLAWSQNYSAGPIQTQTFSLDARQTRQFGGLWPEQPLLDFARANPGRLYINGDEPDQYCIAPYEYAGIYHHFVTTLRGADPTARVSPAGFSEPNERCCPPGDTACQLRMHSIGYADQFYNAYIQRFGEPPHVDEWRFHDFGIAYGPGDIDGWWWRVGQEAAWATAHGAKMVLGAWGFHGWKEEVGPVYQEHLRNAMAKLMSDPRIVQTVYWSYESWAGEAHYLANPDGTLTSEGQTFASPLAIEPANPTTIGSANARAKLEWTNTTAAWGSEVEFWVKAPGADAYVLNNTERLEAGATETPLDAFHFGDSVKGRVRYYNVYGQSLWSPFSNTVVMTLGEVDGQKGDGSGKPPRFCFLPIGIQSAPCD